MPQSYHQIYVHVVFSTKLRAPLLDDSIRPRVHAYMATVARDCGCPFAHVGGPNDHVHILLDVGKAMKLIDTIRKLKQESSKFVKNMDSGCRDFYWQKGYGAFSVSPQYKQQVVDYIDSQIEHHKHTSFKDELINFLKKYEIDYDERYMWD